MKDLGVIQTIIKPLELKNVKIYNFDKSKPIENEKLIKSDSSINSDNILKTDYTFDGKYFENIEKIGAFQPIINLKNAIQ